MPDAAGSWPEEGTQYLPGAPMEPVQQPYQAQPQYQQQQQPYPQQDYGSQQGYEQQQYPAQQQYGVPQQQQQQQYGAPQQQQYPAQPYQGQTMPQPPIFVEEEQASVPSEFDHLFRDSSPVERRSIQAGGPVVSGPGAAASPGFQQAPAVPQQHPQAAQATAVYNPGQAPQGFEDRAQPQYAPSQPFGNGNGYVGESGGGSGAGARRTPLIIGGVVVVVAAIGLYFGLSGGSSSGGAPVASSSTEATQAAPAQTAQQQAAAVYQLVQQSKELRSEINGEVTDLRGCQNLSGLQGRLQSTARSRQAQADKVAKLDVSKITGGAKVVSELNAAWSASAASDSAFAKVASDVASNCTKSAVQSDPNNSAANQAGDEASTHKANAAELWNNTMTNYGQPNVEAADL